MNTWPDTDYATIERYTRTLPLRHAKTRRIYRNELKSFQRFIMCNGNGAVTEDSVTEWVQDRAHKLAPIVAIDHARWVHHFLEKLVQQGYLNVNPIAAIQDQYSIRRLAPIIRALTDVDHRRALEALRPLPRWGSTHGPLMSEHIALMRTMGYRYGSQEVRFAAFDRFLQRRPDLTLQPLKAQLDAWISLLPTLPRAWDGAQLGADLSRAMRLRDPTAELLPRDPRLNRQIRRTYKPPYIYSPAEVSRILQVARDWPAPRWPLLPATMHTMFMLAYCAGLRLGEILRLNVGDVLIPDAAIEIRNTKFFKSRRLPLAESTFSALQNYLKERRRAGGPDEPDSPLLWHQKGAGRYSMTRAEKILFAVLRQAGLKPAHGRGGPRIHDFRHAFVVNRMLAWYREGIDPAPRLPYLVTYLGHKSLHSTLTYLTVTQELLQLASERYRSSDAGKILRGKGGAS
ncbi:MAG: tyrosine-type recombinase/integrase [Gammaproteobacteria bacterium]